ncbi:Concanavalin A-like lectin/glucanase subgroup [Penicillium concentricum]|uniref:Concanavalin A-like lectin/glucanase subgroup n=1 Tax=Penicillium concentricum TaxID=293559 RepID=A0A9W9RBD4_9EURO|nr:Concanavalin A-like lectin/glucanase subgroup [Penicillium concentricum]KAJ5357092.1 Concanavalin A-like lectin/glucanase subgroup [Penicillium concentricum]
MVFYPYLCLLVLYLPGVFSSSLLDFSAARGDNPSMLGNRNLEAARGDTSSSNTDDLYIKLGADPKGVPSLHYHRIEGDIRAEYHSLSRKMASDQTYYIGYQFSLSDIEESLMVWQFKEYAANNAADGGANIPLGLEFKGGQIHLQYQSSYSTGREHQWSQTLKTNTVYSFGIVINTASPGWVELYFDGKMQTFSTSGTTRLAANTFPGRTEPKFGIYRGEVAGIDSYVYRIQIGTSLSDIKEAAGLSGSTTTTKTTLKKTSSTTTTTNTSSKQTRTIHITATTTKTTTASAPTSTTCAWEGHCAGTTCVDDNDCSDPWYCVNGICGNDLTETCE